ncbi:MAG TPA: hypothetical protein VHV82_12670 [Sporichthyaceae bacterium]|jgi:hypothetical protein|nr:hypothetical protein [Sporichthyaceae bacterium]
MRSASRYGHHHRHWNDDDWDDDNDYDGGNGGYDDRYYGPRRGLLGAVGGLLYGLLG